MESFLFIFYALSSHGLESSSIVSEDTYIPLGKNASVFQAETYAILLCVTILKH